MVSSSLAFGRLRRRASVGTSDDPQSPWRTLVSRPLPLRVADHNPVCSQFNVMIDWTYLVALDGRETEYCWRASWPVDKMTFG